MAKSTIERIAVVETKIDSIHEKLDNFIDCSDKKYASKMAEKVVYGMVGFILLFVLGKLVNFALMEPSARSLAMLVG